MGTRQGLRVRNDEAVSVSTVLYSAKYEQELTSFRVGIRANLKNNNRGLLLLRKKEREGKG